MFLPGVVTSGPLLATCRSADDPSVTELTAVLFSGFGSVAPGGTATVTVLERTPTALDAIVPDATNVAACPTRRFTVVDSDPLPLGAAQLEPAGVTHVHVTEVITAGKASMTVAPAMSLGPLFVTT